MLTVNGLTIAYGPIQVVHGVTMNVEEGQIVALIGPNGAGKSSVLRAVSGLLRPNAGDITFLGASIVGVPPHEIAIAGVAHVMEGRHLFGGLSVEDNLILAGSRDDKSSAGNLEAVYQRWPRLRERREQLAGTLSGGEQQMLAIGRALVTRPRLLILDEPSWGLAPRIVRELMDTFVELCREGVTILLCEQMANLALKICDYAYVMTGGRVALEGSSQDLLANPELQTIYLGGEIGEASTIPSELRPFGLAGTKPAERKPVSLPETGLRPVPTASAKTEIDRAEKEAGRRERSHRLLAETGGLGGLAAKPGVPTEAERSQDRHSARERRRQMRARELKADERRAGLEQELMAIRKEIGKLGDVRIPAGTGGGTPVPDTVKSRGPDRRTLEAIRQERQVAQPDSSQEAASAKAGRLEEGRSGWAALERARREREAARRRELSLQEVDPEHRADLERQKGGPWGRTIGGRGPGKDRARLDEQRRQRQAARQADQAAVKPVGKPFPDKPDRKIKEMQRHQKQARGPGGSGNRDSS